MNHTKRLLSLILALVLCFAMTACSSADDKAFEEADALLAAGDYEGAIAAFSAIGRYQEISDKIAEAEQLRNEANMGFLFGNWVDILSGDTFTFNKDCTGVLTQPRFPESAPISITYTYTDGVIHITAPLVWDISVTEIDGITHLIDVMNNYDLVPEAEYSALAPAEPVEIEITMDNWQEYFELKEVNSISINAFGEVSSVQPSVGIFLKEEYYSRLPENYWDIDISFELTYDEAAYKVLNCTPDEYDYNFEGTYELEPTTPPSWWEVQSGCTHIGSVYDQRNYTHIPEESPFYNTVSAELHMYGGSSSDGKTQYVTRWTNIQVSRVIGTLKLFPE